MIININSTPEELQALYKTSALTGMSVDEIIHGAILKEIEEQLPLEKDLSKDEDRRKQRVYKLAGEPAKSCPHPFPVPRSSSLTLVMSDYLVIKSVVIIKESE